MISSFLNFLNKKKWCSIFFLTPLPYAIGNASEMILIASEKAKKEKKKLLILYTSFLSNWMKYYVCNKYLFDNILINNKTQKDNILIKFLIRILLEIQFFFQRTVILVSDKFLEKPINNENLRFLNVGLPLIYETDTIRINNLIRKNFSQITKFNLSYKTIDIQADTKKKCKNILKKFDIDENKIVCLHVRDNKFRKDKGKKEYRNSNINNYVEGIKYLIKNGYHVIRLGRSPSRKIDFIHKFFFDYSQSQIQSDQMDLYLIKKARFYIGTQSGILDLAYMFNKPILTTNMVEIFNTYPRKLVDRGIFKKIFNKKGKQISLESYINLPYLNYHVPENPIKDLNFVQNSSQEILESIIEFEKNLKQPKITFLQRKFNNLLCHSYRNHIDNNIKTKKILDYPDALKQIRMFKSCKGSLCNFFLKEIF